MRPLLISLSIGLFASAPLANDLTPPFTVTTPGKVASTGLFPVLDGMGSVTPGSFGNGLLVSDAPPGASSFVLLGLSEVALPFKGGILGPAPNKLLSTDLVGVDGSLGFAFDVPLIASEGLELWTQFWFQDAGVSFGLAATNTLRVLVQGSFVLKAPVYPQLLVELEAPIAGAAYTKAVGDMNGDGVADLVLSVFGEPFVAVALGEGDARFGEPCLFPGFPIFHGSPNKKSVHLADFDSDGDLDALTLAASSTDDFAILRGDGEGGLAFSALVTVAPNLLELAVGDLNGDGHLDLVTSHSNAKTRILLGVGDNTFQAPVEGPISTGKRPARLGDIDGDGRLDLASALWTRVDLSLGLGDGSSGPVIEVPMEDTVDVKLVDVDADGDLDLLTLDSPADSPSVPRPDKLSLRLGNGDATFWPPADQPALHPIVVGPGLTADFDAFDVGDVDGDGHLDIVAEEHFDLFYIAYGQGGGSFAPAVPSNRQPIVGENVVDLDGDGVDDLLRHDNGSRVVISLGAGDGFAARTDQVSPETGHVAVADVDGDGNDDLLVGRTHSGSGFSVRRGQGDGSFAPGQEQYLAIVPGQSAGKIAVADLDADGDIDVVHSAVNPTR